MVEPVSGVYSELTRQRDLKTHPSICLWCDLLGFGKIFYENNWILNANQKQQVFERLRNAHLSFLRHTSPTGECNLILNDGLIKTSTFNETEHLDLFGFYLRSCIETHLDINREEKDKGYPGARSVLAFGDTIEYFPDKINFDDYVYNYTKPDPTKLSSVAHSNGNPVIVYNPISFQMNTGFSKSYILENMGNEKNISGNHFYLDESFIQYTRYLSKKRNVEYFEENNVFGLKKREDYFYYGFEYDYVIEITKGNWKTKVYRISSFFPPDEPISSFKYELIQNNGT